MQIATAERLLERARAQPPIAAIGPALAASAADIYLVGGTVRDLILGRPFLDVDLAVDGDAGALAAALAGPIGEPPAAETRFGTVSIELGGHRYDLARTRSESYRQPGALPDVEEAGIDDDLGRRDFTVNAIALGLAGRRAGELLTPPGAPEDLAARRLAVLHDRSFLDDPTRLFRLARYAARLGFEPTPHTRELATEAIANQALDMISGTRVGNELRLLASEPDPIAAFQAVQDLGLPWAIDGEAASSALPVLPADGRPELLVLACVLTEVDGQALDAMGFTAEERRAILEGGQAPALARRLAAASSNSAIARTVGTSGIETVALASSQGAPSQSLTWLQDLRHRSLEITGNDLLQNGIEQGPAVGRALQAARDAMLDGQAPDRDSQLARALQAAQ